MRQTPRPKTFDHAPGADGHRGCYVTGTDTGVGKTLASSALLHALRASGLRAVGMKPLASGCEWIDGAWRNDDALALQDASDPRPAYADVNPYALRLPLAPELAARADGVDVQFDVLLQAHARLATLTGIVVVEGVGGWLAPLSPSIDQADLARALHLPVIMVVGLRLGCLNHARLTADRIRSDGLSLAGWIASEIDPSMDCQDENMQLLGQRLPARCLGRLTHQANPDPAVAAVQLMSGLEQMLERIIPR